MLRILLRIPKLNASYQTLLKCFVLRIPRLGKYKQYTKVNEMLRTSYFTTYTNVK